MSDDVVLAVNSGSSSLKIALFAADGPELRAIAEGAVEGIGVDDGRVWLRIGERKRTESSHPVDHAAACATLLRLLDEEKAPRVTLVGHRVVHGGPHHVEPARVDDALVDSLRSIVPLARIHLPAALACIEAVSRALPEVPAVACFDTAFHATMPEVARRLPLPSTLVEQGLRRYGFHGLSYEHAMSKLGSPPPPRVILAHLGSGASLVAVRDGVAADTTMGLTPLGGVMMGTRTGDLDPGVLLYLLREKRFTLDALEHLLEREAGLAAVGGTPDMKALLARHDDDARLAVAMFAYGVRKTIGAFAAVLGGVDVLVFTGGIGEHAAEVRALACEGLAPLGVVLDETRNQAHAPTISPDGAACVVRVIAADEDRVIARHAVRVVRGALR